MIEFSEDEFSVVKLHEHIQTHFMLPLDSGIEVGLTFRRHATRKETIDIVQCQKILWWTRNQSCRQRMNDEEEEVNANTTKRKMAVQEWEEYNNSKKRIF